MSFNARISDEYVILLDSLGITSVTHEFYHETLRLHRFQLDFDVILLRHVAMILSKRLTLCH